MENNLAASRSIASRSASGISTPFEIANFAFYKQIFILLKNDFLLFPLRIPIWSISSELTNFVPPFPTIFVLIGSFVLNMLVRNSGWEEGAVSACLPDQEAIFVAHIRTFNAAKLALRRCWSCNWFDLATYQLMVPAFIKGPSRNSSLFRHDFGIP